MAMSGGSVDRPLRDLLRGVQRLAIQGADEGSEILASASSTWTANAGSSRHEEPVAGATVTSAGRFRDGVATACRATRAATALAARFRHLRRARAIAEQRQT